jgi:hypothetical protein
MHSSWSPDLGGQERTLREGARALHIQDEALHLYRRENKDPGRLRKESDTGSWKFPRYSSQIYEEMWLRMTPMFE